MSDLYADEQWEKIWDEIEEHIEAYFEDGHEDELVNFIFDNEKVKGIVFEAIADSPLGKKIAQEVFEGLPEGREYDKELDG